jgi:1-acyl-sn-glycerol-3-phosphate acyltransferase
MQFKQHFLADKDSEDMYEIARVFFSLFFALVWSFKVEGADNVPKHGGGVVCSNHFSAWDPVTLGLAVPRQVAFLAKEELFHFAFFRWIILRLGGVKVKRGQTDSQAIREILRNLEAGKLCGIFPEGTRYNDGELHAFYQGAAYFAIKTGTPLIPAYIFGDYSFRGTLKVSIGKPIFPPKQVGRDRTEMTTLTNELMQAISELKGEEDKEEIIIND